MDVVRMSSSATRPPSLNTRPQRVAVAVGLILAAVVTVLAGFEVGSQEAVGAETTTTSSTVAATSTTIPGPLLALGAFPVQGKCSFIDTYGAPRSGGRLHEGVDIMAKAGQYVYAVAAGTLTKQYLDTPGSLSGYGWRLTAPDGTYYFYAHFSGFAPGLAVGDKVVAGQIIGYVGETGNAGTPHLHFEIHPGGGAAVNPTSSVKAIDGCAVTTIPTVATNPPNPSGGQDIAATVPTTPPTLALAVRIPVTESTTETPTTILPTTPTTPTTPATTPTPTPTPPTSTDPLGSGRWTFVEPVIVFNGSGTTALAAGVTKHITVAGVSGLAASPAAIMARVSATASVAGNVVVHPCSSTVPQATTLSVDPGRMAITSAMTPVVGGKICVTAGMAANVKVTVTAQASTTGAGLRPLTTVRALDTRLANQISVRLKAAQKVTLSPAMLAASASAKAVTATFTIVNPSAAGNLVIAACGGTEVNAPFINTSVTSFSLVVPVNSTGLCVSSSVATDLVVDVDGAWEPDAPAIAALAPVRVLGTSTVAAATSATPTAVAIAGVAGLPATATSAHLSVTLIGASSVVSVFVWPCEQPRPTAAVGAVAASKKATFAVSAAVTNGQLCVATDEAASVFVDVSGAG